jgi:magnesium transporter
MTGKSYLRYFNLFSLFDTKRTKELFRVNPTMPVQRKEPPSIVVEVHAYDAHKHTVHTMKSVEQCSGFKNKHQVTWLNIDGIRKSDVESISRQFNIHMLLQEDILSIGQRPKMDEMKDMLFCLLNMLYYNEATGDVEQEQISIVLGDGFVISFQEDPDRDVFNQLREKLKIDNSKLRQSSADYLCYAMLDMIVDHYFVVMEKLSDRIEQLEEKIIRNSNTRSLAEINDLRKELIVLRRNVGPVRDIVNGFMRSESDVLNENTTKYFKDIYDHILQANELVDNYRDMMMNLHDLYISNVNLRMNEVMKVMAIVTCLLAPATVIGGIFGMNFELIPIAHQKNGFYIAVALMFAIPIIMLMLFRRRGWF